MSYRVVVARSAARRVAEKLPDAVAAACVEFILGALAADPHRVGAPLRKPFEGHWRARRGEYRSAIASTRRPRPSTCSTLTIVWMCTAIERCAEPGPRHLKVPDLQPAGRHGDLDVLLVRLWAEPEEVKQPVDERERAPRKLTSLAGALIMRVSTDDRSVN